MKFLFLKILLLIFIFGSGLNLSEAQTKGMFFINIMVAILMGIAVCMCP